MSKAYTVSEHQLKQTNTLSRNTPPSLPSLSYCENEYDRIICKVGLPSRRKIYNTLGSSYLKDDRTSTRTNSAVN